MVLQKINRLVQAIDRRAMQFNNANKGIILYFLLALAIAPTGALSLDSFYYWSWSQHLALSYYDGPPMIAYFIRLWTFLWGDTLFTLALLSLTITALTTIIVYKTGRLFLNKEASTIAMLLWLFTPLVSQVLLREITYDGPFTLFWSLIIYYSARYIKYNKTGDLYNIGINVGFMMLSKYSGIVLVLSLLVFLVTTDYRRLFKTYHLYLAIALAVIIFSPVIWWNYQHEWLSFLYQLNTHLGETLKNTLMRYFFKTFFGLGVFLIPPVLYCYKVHYKKSLIGHLCFVNCVVIISFYFFTACCRAEIRGTWLLQYLMSAALLSGYCFQEFNYRKIIVLILTFNQILSVIFLLNQAYFHNSYEVYRLIEQFSLNYSPSPNLVLASNWQQAPMMFFFRNRPETYTLNCGEGQNQYALWSEEINQKIRDKTLKKALYISIDNNTDCPKKYFDKCTKIIYPSHSVQHRTHTIYAYNCINV